MSITHDTHTLEEKRNKYYHNNLVIERVTKKLLKTDLSCPGADPGQGTESLSETLNSLTINHQKKAISDRANMPAFGLSFSGLSGPVKATGRLSEREEDGFLGITSRKSHQLSLNHEMENFMV